MQQCQLSAFSIGATFHMEPMEAQFPTDGLWRLLLELMVLYKVKDVRLRKYPYECGFVGGTPCGRTPFETGKKKWVPVKPPCRMYPDLEEFPCKLGEEWYLWAKLLKTFNTQDRGVDARMWWWPMEFKYQEETWWERNHTTDREWIPCVRDPLSERPPSKL